MNSSRFANNVSALKVISPALSAEISANASNGKPFVKENKPKINFYQNPSIIFLGLGHYLSALNPSDPRIKRIFVFEEQIENLIAACYELDLQPLIDSNKLRLFINTPLQDITNQFYQHYFQDILFGFTMLPSPSAYYRQIQQTIQDIYQIKLTTIKTNFQATAAMYDNLFSNLPILLQQYAVQSVCNTLKNKPAVIVGPGPSLETSLEILQRMDSNYFIIALDTSVPILIRHNIIPNAIVTIDYTPQNFRHFVKQLPVLKNTTLIADPCASHQVIQAYPGPIITYNPKLPILNWIETVTGPWGRIKRGPSVSLGALDFARQLGADPIIFAGLDFAYQNTGKELKTYADGNAKKDVRIPKKFITVRGNSHDTVYTSSRLNTYRIMIEHYLAEHPEIHYYNMSHGALIQNATPILQPELKKPISSFKNLNPQKPILHNAESQTQINQILNQKIKLLTKMNTQSQEMLNITTVSSLSQQKQKIIQMGDVYEQIELLMNKEIFQIKKREAQSEPTTASQLKILKLFSKGVFEKSKSLIENIISLIQ